MGVGESGSCCQITKFNGTLWTTSTLNRFTFNNSRSSHVTRIVRDGFGNLYSPLLPQRVHMSMQSPRLSF